MRCSECGAEAPVMKTVYWPEEGDDAEEWPLCDGCYAEVAHEVLIVAGPAYCFGTCRRCEEWFSVKELTELRPAGWKWGAPSGLCPECAREGA
jgi:hypothetical protein